MRTTWPLFWSLISSSVKGFSFLRDVKENKRDLEEHELAALKILDDFFKEKGKAALLQNVK